MSSEKLRKELKKPFGKIYSGKKMPTRLRCKLLITVGDICSLTFHRLGKTPDIMVVDFKTKRLRENELDEKISAIGARIVLRAKNPAGTIKPSLWNAIEFAIELKTANPRAHIIVEVEGEEDLAALPCMFLARNGSIVAYGLPNVGMVLVRVTPAIKKRVKNILNLMH